MHGNGGLKGAVVPATSECSVLELDEMLAMLVFSRKVRASADFFNLETGRVLRS